MRPPFHVQSMNLTQRLNALQYGVDLYERACGNGQLRGQLDALRNQRQAVLGRCPYAVAHDLRMTDIAKLALRGLHAGVDAFAEKLLSVFNANDGTIVGSFMQLPAPPPASRVPPGW